MKVPSEFFGGYVLEITFRNIYLKVKVEDKAWKMFCAWCDKMEWRNLRSLDPITYQEFKNITKTYNLSDFCHILRDMDNWNKITKNKSISKTAVNWMKRNKITKKGIHQ